jgi:hypothetical protein
LPDVEILSFASSFIVWRNIVHVADMNNFSSNIFSSAPLFLDKMGDSDVVCSSLAFEDCGKCSLDYVPT